MGVMLFPSLRLGNASGGGGAFFAPHSLFFSLSSSSSFLPLLSSFLFSLFSSSTAFSSASSSLCFSSLSPSFFFFYLSFPLFFFAYHTPFFCLSPLSPPSLFFFFFRGKLFVLSALQDVIEDTASCNRLQSIRNKERFVMSMNSPIACLFYIIELFEASN